MAWNIRIREHICSLPTELTQILNFNEQNSPLLSNSTLSAWQLIIKPEMYGLELQKEFSLTEVTPQKEEEKFTKVYTFPESCERRLYGKCYNHRTY
jgi:hypothetical protein